ncbi:MAG: hypothetical protein L6R40_002143 [Gallowayella cf. fulva]|nr:MAG: hypothetical protein L6R40_002143 [Xanthomendoza cf. fulva]
MAFNRSKFSRSSTTSSSGSLLSKVPLWVLRFLQFIFAITVIGLYAQDLRRAHNAHVYSDSKWGYATAVGVIGAVSSLVLAWPRLSSVAWPWDLVVFILFTALFGLFGKMFIHENAEGVSGVKRMKNAVWIDLINMLLWFVTAIYGMIMFFFLGKSKSLHTGRATV